MGFNLFNPSSWGQGAATAVGGIGGFLVGGPAGAVVGAGLGSQLGGGGGGSASAPQGNAGPGNYGPGGYTGGGSVGGPGNAGSGGNSGTPGLFGQGMYQSNNYGINGLALNNPNFQPGAYQGAANSYIGNAVTGNNVNAAQAANGDYTNYNTGINGQLGVANQFNQMAQGNGPSLANVQAQQQGQQNLAATESMLGSARGGGNPAATQLAARNAGTQGQQQIAQNAVQGRTAEELGAMNAAGGLYGNVAGQGLQQVGTQQNNNQFNAGQMNQIAQGNQANAMAGYTNQLNSLANQGLAQQQGGIAGQQLGVQQQLGLGQIGSTAYNNAAQNNQKIAGGIAQGLGSIVGGVI